MRIGWNEDSFEHIDFNCDYRATAGCPGDNVVMKILRSTALDINEPIEFVNLTGQHFEHIRRSQNQSSFFEIFGALEAGEVDVLANMHTITVARSERFLFLYPLIHGEYYFVTGRTLPGTFADAWRFMDVFALELWFVLIVLITLCVCCYKMSGVVSVKRDVVFRGNCWNLLEHFLGQNNLKLQRAKATASQAYIVLLTSLFTIFSMSLYQNCLLGSLLRPTTSEAQVDTLDTLIDKIQSGEVTLAFPSDDYAVIEQINYGSSEPMLRLRRAVRINPIRYEADEIEFDKMLHTGTYITIEDMTRRWFAGDPLPCQLEAVPVEDAGFIPARSSFMFSPMSPALADRVNQALLLNYDYVMNIIANIIDHNQFKRLEQCSGTQHGAADSGSDQNFGATEQVTLKTLIGSVFMWATGMIVGFGVCLMEMVNRRYRGCRRSQKHTHNNSTNGSAEQHNDDTHSRTSHDYNNWAVVVPSASNTS